MSIVRGCGFRFIAGRCTFRLGRIANSSPWCESILYAIFAIDSNGSPAEHVSRWLPRKPWNWNGWKFAFSLYLRFFRSTLMLWRPSNGKANKHKMNKLNANTFLIATRKYLFGRIDFMTAAAGTLRWTCVHFLFLGLLQLRWLPLNSVEFLSRSSYHNFFSVALIVWSQQKKQNSKAVQQRTLTAAKCVDWHSASAANFIDGVDRTN